MSHQLEPTLQKIKQAQWQEPIQMLKRRAGVFPLKFQWAERVIQVEAVERCWTELQPEGESGGGYYHFQVRCNGERYYLREAFASGTWSLTVVCLSS